MKKWDKYLNNMLEVLDEEENNLLKDKINIFSEHVKEVTDILKRLFIDVIPVIVKSKEFR